MHRPPGSCADGVEVSSRESVRVQTIPGDVEAFDPGPHVSHERRAGDRLGEDEREIPSHITKRRAELNAAHGHVEDRREHGCERRVLDTRKSGPCPPDGASPASGPPGSMTASYDGGTSGFRAD